MLTLLRAHLAPANVHVPLSFCIIITKVGKVRSTPACMRNTAAV
jgi:hypothetical protein